MRTEIERATILSMLLDNETISPILELVDVEDFEDGPRQPIVQVICDLENLYQGHAPIDATAVINHLREVGLYEAANGVDEMIAILKMESSEGGAAGIRRAQSLRRLSRGEEQLEVSGKDDYAAYLRSPEWLAKADMVKRSAGYRCQVCNRGDLIIDTHHRTYERLGCELFQDLVALCRECHTLFHKNGKLAR